MSNLLNIYEESRPWGKFREFTKNRESTVKIISVKKGESLSLQNHKQRSEFWRVLSGEPEITAGDQITQAKPGDEFSFGIGVNHRIAAPNGDVEVLEIGIGYFDNNDIVRLKDKYGRN